jgi:hypothetical protein
LYRGLQDTSPLNEKTMKLLPKRFPLSLLICLAVVIPSSLVAQPVTTHSGQDLIIDHDNGRVNWTEQYVEATGATIINRDRFPNEQQAYLMAVRGAEVVAKANLLEIIEGIAVYRETVVRDFLTESDLVRTQVQGVVRGARRIGEARRDGDMVEVLVRLPLYGAIAPIIHPMLPDAPPVDPRRTYDEAETVTPADISADLRHSDPDDQAAAGGNDSPKVKPQYILHFKDGKFDPSLFPVLVDEKGNVILDMSKLYQHLPPDVLKYVDLSKDLMDVFNFPEGVELIEAIQRGDGTITVKTDKNKKFNKFLKDAVRVGKVLLPIALAFL